MQALLPHRTYVSGMNTTLQLLRCRPTRLIARLVPVAITIQVLIDVLMGSGAEYFNAAHFLSALADFVTGGGLHDAPRFVVGQENLSDVSALGLGTALLLVVPTVALMVIILPISWLMRRKGAAPCN